MELPQPKPTKSKQPSPAKNWCFTFNNYTDEDIKILSSSNSSISSYIFGEEVAPTTGTKHLQGYIQFKTKVRPMGMFNDKIHWEKARGSREANINYCGKDGVVYTNMPDAKPLKVIKELYPWQQDILKIALSEPDDRSVYWIWEEVGNVGKTAFAKYLAHFHGAIPLEGKKNDILYCAAEFPSNIYIYDIARTNEQYISYDAIEKIKNGFYMCAKYESKPIIRNPPHVFIFANFRPNIDALSKDRWRIHEINPEKVLL